jgi:hypothetical protein
VFEKLGILDSNVGLFYGETGAALMDAGLSIAGLIGAQVCKCFHRKNSSSHVCASSCSSDACRSSIEIVICFYPGYTFQVSSNAEQQPYHGRLRARACVAGLGGCMACGSVTEKRRRWNADCLMMWCLPTTQRQPVATLHTAQYRWGGALHVGDATLLAVDSCYRNHRTHHMLCTHPLANSYTSHIRSCNTMLRLYVH